MWGLMEVPRCGEATWGNLYSLAPPQTEALTIDDVGKSTATTSIRLIFDTFCLCNGCALLRDIFAHESSAKATACEQHACSKTMLNLMLGLPSLQNDPFWNLHTLCFYERSCVAVPQIGIQVLFKEIVPKPFSSRCKEVFKQGRLRRLSPKVPGVDFCHCGYIADAKTTKTWLGTSLGSLTAEACKPRSSVALWGIVSKLKLPTRMEKLCPY